MNLALAFALLLTLGLGGGIWALLDGLPQRRSELFAAIGYSVLLGLVGAGLLATCMGNTVGPALWRVLWPLMLCSVVSLWILQFWLVRGKSATWSSAPRQPRLGWWGWILLALLGLHALLIVDEAWLRPVFPWDAWLAWTAKAKAWFEGAQVQPFVAPDAWLADVSGSVRTSLAFHYPELLSRIELWLSAPFGVWNELAIGAAWPLLWVAMLLGCYGQWRRLGVDRNLAVVGVYALGSLPLLDVHAALAGYADLWIAVTLAFGVLSWQIFLHTGARGQLLLTLILIVIIPLLKFEGFGWSLLLAGTVAVGQISPRHRWKGLAAAAGLALLALGVSYWLDLPWLNMVHRLMSGEAGGRDAASVWSVVGALVSGLFAQNNWHLLWFVLPCLLALRWRALIARRDLALLALFVGAALATVAALFLLTPAAKWAESNTAINRLVLQLVPTVLSLAVLLLRDVDLSWLFPGKDPESERPPAAA